MTHVASIADSAATLTFLGVNHASVRSLLDGVPEGEESLDGLDAVERNLPTLLKDAHAESLDLAYAALRTLRAAVSQALATRADRMVEGLLTGSDNSLVRRAARVEALDATRQGELSPGVAKAARAIYAAAAHSHLVDGIALSESTVRHPEIDRVTEKMTGRPVRAREKLSPAACIRERWLNRVPVDLQMRASRLNLLGQPGIGPTQFSMNGPEDHMGARVSIAYLAKGLEIGLTQLLFEGFAFPERAGWFSQAIEDLDGAASASTARFMQAMHGPDSAESRALAALLPEGASLESVARGFSAFWINILGHEASHQLEGERFVFDSAQGHRPHLFLDGQKMWNDNQFPTRQAVLSSQAYRHDEATGWLHNYLAMAQYATEIGHAGQFLLNLLESEEPALEPLKALMKSGSVLGNIDASFAKYYVVADAGLAALFQEAFDAGLHPKSLWFDIFADHESDGLEGFTEQQREILQRIRRRFIEEGVTQNFRESAQFMEACYSLGRMSEGKAKVKPEEVRRHATLLATIAAPDADGKFPRWMSKLPWQKEPDALAWTRLASRAAKVADGLLEGQVAPEHRDAFVRLVRHPVGN
ncbi:MAG: hypothetical protein AAF654_08835 [Myxococcota bacterium]